MARVAFEGQSKTESAPNDGETKEKPKWSQRPLELVSGIRTRRMTADALAAGKLSKTQRKAIRKRELAKQREYA